MKKTLAGLFTTVALSTAVSLAQAGPLGTLDYGTYALSSGSNWELVHDNYTFTIADDVRFTFDMNVGPGGAEVVEYSIENPATAFSHSVAQYQSFSDTLLLQAGDYSLNIFAMANDFTSSMTLQPVPVPAAAWLFLSGLLGLAGLARRK